MPSYLNSSEVHIPGFQRLGRLAMSVATSTVGVIKKQALYRKYEHDILAPEYSLNFDPMSIILLPGALKQHIKLVENHGHIEELDEPNEGAPTLNI